MQSVDGVGMVGGVAPGDWVSLHWEWVCDRLTETQVAGCAATPSGTWPSSTTASARRPRCRLIARPSRPASAPASRSRRRPPGAAAVRAARTSDLAQRGAEQVVGVRAAEPDGRNPAAERSPPRRAQPGRTSSWPSPGTSSTEAGPVSRAANRSTGSVVHLLRRADLHAAARRAAAPPGRPARAPPRRRAWRTARPRRWPTGGRPARRGRPRARGCRGARSARRTGTATAAGPARGRGRRAAAHRRRARPAAGRPGGRCAAGPGSPAPRRGPAAGRCRGAASGRRRCRAPSGAATGRSSGTPPRGPGAPAAPARPASATTRRRSRMVPRAGREEPGDRVQQRRLARAGRAQQRQHLARPHGEGHPAQRRRPARTPRRAASSSSTGSAGSGPAPEPATRAAVGPAARPAGPGPARRA